MAVNFGVVVVRFLSLREILPETLLLTRFKERGGSPLGPNSQLYSPTTADALLDEPSAVLALEYRAPLIVSIMWAQTSAGQVAQLKSQIHD